jgi:hypothetical protein
MLGKSLYKPPWLIIMNIFVFDRVIWFESIIKNDHEIVKHMIACGQDVNMRAGPEDLDLFTFYWTTRCKSNTVFFDCRNPVEDFRPNGAHVAIFFNSKESLRHIAVAQVLFCSPMLPLPIHKSL